MGKEAQEIFDALNRMLPTRWDGKDIIVMDQVVVKGPGYRSEDCRAEKEAGSALARVKKVVSKFPSRVGKESRAGDFAAIMV